MIADWHPAGQGYECYGCRRQDRDVLNVPDLPYPTDWLCGECLATHIRAGLLVVRRAVDEPGIKIPNCFNCATPLDGDQEIENAVCGVCWNNFECDESHGCHDCGDYTTVYCESCAQNNWGSGARECDRCSSEASYHQCDDHVNGECDSCSDEAETHLCEKHLQERIRNATQEQVSYAQAADAIEVSWGDEQ